MKKLNHTSIIIALILLSYRVQGQIYVPDSLTLEEAILQSNDTIFANIDSNSISTKILLNKCHIVDTNFVYAFDGVAGNSFDPEVLRNKFSTFLNIMARLATHNENLNKFVELVDKSIERSWKSDTLFLNVADINYNVFKSSSSLLSFGNNQYIVNTNNQTLLYDTKKFFCATPNKYYNIGNSFTLLLPDSLTFTNTLFTYNYFIDVGSGYQSFATNQSFTFAATADSMFVHLLAVCSNNDSLISSFWLYNKFPPVLINGSVNKISTVSSEWQCGFQYGKYTLWDLKGEFTSNWNLQNAEIKDRGKDDNDKYASPAEGNFFIKYSCKNDGKLTKPFIFVEGVSFDAKSLEVQKYYVREYFGIHSDIDYTVLDTLYKETYNLPLDSNFLGYSTFNWGTLVTGVEAEGLTSDPSNPLKVEKCPELLSKLCKAGYDIVFVDFASGQMHLDNNGTAVYEVLKKVHHMMELDHPGETLEKMVVCGASMGGVVSRYGLNLLEADGHIDWISHFISFDSPQMGANIPLAAQHFLHKLKWMGGDTKVKYKKLTCPSAAELIRYSVLGTDVNFPHESPERLWLLQNDANFTNWPSCHKVSIINGSRYGTYQENNNGGLLNAGDMMTSTQGFMGTKMWALPQFQSNLELILHTKIFVNFMIVPIFMTKRLKFCNPIDHVAGSYTWLIRDVYNGLYKTSWFNFNSPSPQPKYTKHCFIPAYSALGLKNFEIMTKNEDNSFFTTLTNSNGKYKDPNHTHSYFDIMFAPTTNQGHVEITDENIGWVMQVLNDCDDEVIKFQNEVIPSGTYTACNAIYAGNDVGKFANCAENVRALLNTTTSVIPCMDTPPTSTSNDIVTATSSYFTQNYLEDPNNPNDDYIEMCVYTINHYGYNTISNCGPAKVLNGSNVTFKAGNIIDLKPGFEVETGATFDAQIIGSTQNACLGTARYANNENTPQASITNTGIAISNSKGKNQKNKNYELPDYSINNPISNVNDEFRLVPNPANDKTTLIYSLEIASQVTIEILTIYGQNVTKNISENEQSSGAHSVELDISKLSKGAYFVTLKSKNGNKSKQLLVN